MTGIITRFGLNLTSISSWRNRATYPDDLYANGYYAYEQVDDYILTALSVTSAVISEVEFAAPANDSRVTRTRQRWHFTAETYDTTEPHSREPRQTPLRITGQLETLKLKVIPGQRWLFDSPEL